MISKPFEKFLIVTSEHIDEMNHVNNVVYLHWVQDIAKQHWESKTNQSLRDTYVWVVLKHCVEYYKPAFLGDDIHLKTWIENYNGAKSERHTQIINKSTGKILSLAKTNWCLLSKMSLKPLRITDEIGKLFR